MAVFLQGCPRVPEGLLVEDGGAAVWEGSCGEMGCAAFAFVSLGCSLGVMLKSGETYMRYSLLIGCMPYSIASPKNFFFSF